MCKTGLLSLSTSLSSSCDLKFPMKIKTRAAYLAESNVHVERLTAVEIRESG
jgi:hypothetical protein